jgi:CRP/FNR family transcriptional regulator, cyclic AMP receptor protein
MASLSPLGPAVITAIERSPLFRSAGHDTLDALLDRGRLRTVGRGGRLTHQGVEDDHLYLVVSGWLKRYRLSSDGREIILDVPGQGNVVGLVQVLDGRPPCHGTTALASTDLLEVPGHAVRRRFQEDAAFAVVTTRMLVDIVRTRERELVHLSTEDARTRFMERLLDLAEAGTEDGGVLPVGLSQEELASWAGVSRESAARTLHELRDRSILRTGRRRIVIDDLESLREVIGGAGPLTAPLSADVRQRARTPSHLDHRPGQRRSVG